MNRREFLLSTACLGLACFAPSLDPADVELIDPMAESFRAQFNLDVHHPRLLILLSST